MINILTTHSILETICLSIRHINSHLVIFKIEISLNHTSINKMYNKNYKRTVLPKIYKFS